MNFIISIPVIVISLVILAALSFFFSASETSLIALSKIRLRHMVNQGVKNAVQVQRVVTKLDKFIAAILIGNNFVNIAISAIVTAVLVNLVGNSWGVLIATFLTAFLILIFCEITPKILATKHTERVALFVAPFVEALIVFFEPLIRIFIGMSNLIMRLARIQPTKRSPLITEEELRLMIEVGREEGVLSEQERKMLHRIFEFGDITVSDVMIPKEKMITVNIRASQDELMHVFVEEGHARLPIYEQSPDNIVGIMFARDLLYLINQKELFVLDDLLHPAFFCAPEVKVNDLLKEFLTRKIQIAIVAAADRKALGLVTLEDLVEEIVGEIEETRSGYYHGAK